jgi:hypothetical protein
VNKIGSFKKKYFQFFLYISTAFTNILFLYIKVLVFLPLKINLTPLTKVNMVNVTILWTISGPFSNFCSHS